MSEEVLTKEIAEQFIADEYSVDLYEFTKLDDDAAEILSTSDLDTLPLDGLTELSDAGAESLSKYVGILELNGLTELSDAAAESLSKHDGTLELIGLYELSEAAAKSLAKIDPDKIFLPEELEELVAKYR